MAAQRTRVLKGWLLIAAATATILGCAPATSYMGIDLTAAGVGPVPAIMATDSTSFYQAYTLPQLASRAQAGDKHAQLELGIRFEEGRGVPIDMAKARKLYEQAASDSGGTIWVYSPPVGNGTIGRVIAIESAPMQQGLSAAKKRTGKQE